MKKIEMWHEEIEVEEEKESFCSRPGRRRLPSATHTQAPSARTTVRDSLLPAAFCSALDVLHYVASVAYTSTLVPLFFLPPAALRFFFSLVQAVARALIESPLLLSSKKKKKGTPWIGVSCRSCSSIPDIWVWRVRKEPRRRRPTFSQ